MEYEELTLSNDFIFAKVMQNKSLCKKLLEIILKIKIRDIAYHEEQKVLEDSPDGKAVRLDVYVEDDKNSVFDLEMQASNNRELPKRSRYYQGRIDVSILEKGNRSTYRNLKDSYIIFICLEDIFGAGRHYYYFENTCREDRDLKLGDGAVKVFLNADSDMDDIDEELRNFLNYLRTGIPTDDFTDELEGIVRYARTNKDWKEEYLAVDMQRRIWEQDAREKGMAEGRAEGLAEGELRATIKYVERGLISIEEAAKDLGISVPEMEEAVRNTRI
jgi:predicted transposase/invertase (TIGR01784 family)